MASMVDRFDWTATPLGPIREWPQSLHTAAGICLESRFPMALWWGDAGVQLYNDGYVPVLGAKHPRALGQRHSECWAEIWDVVGPLFDTVRATGEATWSDDLLLMMYRHGYMEETYFTFSYSPIRDESGGVGGVLITCVETTERVVGTRRLRALRRLADHAGSARSVEDAGRLIAETLGDAKEDVPFAHVYLLDSDGVPALAASTAARPPEPGEWPLAEADTSEGPVVVDPAPSATGGHRALILPLRRRGLEGTAGLLVAGVSDQRPLDVGYRDFFDLVAEQCAALVANARAHDEERHRAEVLAELDRAKTVFFSNVSHELRTPLTLILGPVTEAIGGVEDDASEVQRERLTLVRRNAQRLLKLVNTLLDFSRIEAGRARAHYEPTDLSALTADLASTFRAAVEAAGLRLTVDCPPLGEPVWVDREMWEKIVLNLLSNALKFTFDGEIGVSLRVSGDDIHLAVRDTGIGVAAEDMEQLFTRFHRVRGARSRSHEGTGIGLALVRELAMLHGGDAEADSTPAVGSVFTVRVPRGTAHLPAAALTAESDPAPSSTAIAAELFADEAQRWLPEPDVPAVDPVTPAGAGGRILVVDDNADMRGYLRRLLSDHWHVDLASDGLAALRSAMDDPPDLILSDVMMPGIDGLEFVGRLRAEPATRALPVVLLSARAGQEAVAEGLQAGADDYLVKPFTAQELLVRVSGHIELARMREELARTSREVETRQAVAAEQEKIRMLAETSSDMVGRYALDGTVLYLSPAARRITGFTPEELVGRSALDFIHPDDLPQVRRDLAALPGSPAPLTTLSRWRRRDGGWAWVEWISRTVFDGAGAPQEIHASGRDVGARVEAELRVVALAEREAAMRRVATSVASGVPPRSLFATVADESGSLLGADASLVLRCSGDQKVVVGAWGAAPDALGTKVPLESAPGLSTLADGVSPWIVDDVRSRPEATSWVRRLVGAEPLSMAAVPIRVGASVWGCLLLVSTARAAAFSPPVADRLTGFAELVGVGVANADARLQLQTMASTDHLTGLPNHREFQKRLEEDVERARRRELPLSLVVMDLDRFKQVNDLLGHDGGNRVLVEVAKRLRRLARRGETIARIGGEEFAWILPDTDGAQAFVAAERAREAIAGRPFDDSLSITTSVGVSDLAEAHDPGELFRLADLALYWAKGRGRNSTFRYTPEELPLVSADEQMRRRERDQALIGIQALARAVDARDPLTQRHSERVARMAERLAVAAGWSGERAALLREAGLVHDVGKIGVPDAILLKPAPLEPDEYEVVKGHAAAGATIIAGVLSDEQVSWVRHHHERADGLGYPDGIAGVDMPEGAQILALADAWDAMTTRRPYQEPRPPVEVYALCTRESGRQFTEFAVEALRSLWLTDAEVRRSSPVESG